MAPSITRVGIEAFVVGLGLVVIFQFVCTMYKYRTNQSLLVNVFVSGALFHVLCELSGLNRWYVDNYK